MEAGVRSVGRGDFFPLFRPTLLASSTAWVGKKIEHRLMLEQPKKFPCLPPSLPPFHFMFERRGREALVCAAEKV